MKGPTAVDDYKQRMMALPAKKAAAKAALGIIEEYEQLYTSKLEEAAQGVLGMLAFALVPAIPAALLMGQPTISCLLLIAILIDVAALRLCRIRVLLRLLLHQRQGGGLD